VADLEKHEGTRRLLERYLHQDGESWMSVVYLYPPVEKWRREPPPEAEALAERLGPRAELTGVNVVSRALRQQVWIDAVLAAVIGTIAVALLLWLDYRRFGDALLSLVPLSIGIVWMLGVMAAFGMKVNFMNIFVTTMIIGIGVDYGVHMLHRRRELGASSGRELERGLKETGQAIAMAAVTTSVGFGSLSLSHYPGLRSIGFVAILGAVATALVAITMLPAYLSLQAERSDS
ncbi:MAG: MMPL family transporter, partial [Holophagales bacterium]|nr:MMPL family transporter [Holophagales bacterium]